MAEPAQEVYRVDWTGRAMIGSREFPISSVQVRFELNEIPVASLTIPVGRDPSSGKSISPGDVLNGLDMNTPISIYITASYTKDAPKPGGLKNGEFKIFEGYVLTPGYERAFNLARVNINAYGALGALSAGTSLIDTVVEFVADDGTGQYKATLGNNKNKVLALDLLTKRQLYAGLSPALYLLWKDMAAGTISSTSGQARSEEAVKAMGRLNYGKTNLGLSAAIGSELNSIPGGTDAWDKALASALCNLIFKGAWSNNTIFEDRDADLWTMLRETGNHFMFSIVPTVEEGVFAPILPNIRGTTDHEIEPNEYFVSSIAPLTDRMFGHTSRIALYASGAQVSNNASGESKTKIIGKSRLTGALGSRGRLKLLGAPLWLLPPGAPARDTLNPTEGITDATNTEAAKKKSEQGNLELAYYNSPIGNAYAETILYTDLFSERQMSISGRVRTDIAPGNQVKLITAGDNFGLGPAVLYGMVYAVSINLGEGKGNTEVMMSHFRTEKEQESCTVAVHPLYKEKWKGIPLV